MNPNTQSSTSTESLRKIVHIGWMRTGTTYLQGIFKQHPDIHASLKNRFFSYEPYFSQGQTYYDEILEKASPNQHIFVDSDENYSMGRFKTVLREKEKRAFNLKSELSFISHDIPQMIDRIKSVVPDAQIVGMIRTQSDWFSSVYKHDVANFALDQSFEDFFHSELGKSYQLAADYMQIIEQLWDAFGKEKVKIFLFEDFKNTNEAFLRDLSSFMQVELTNIKKSKLKKNISPDNFFTSLYRQINKLSEKQNLKPENSNYLKLRDVVGKIEGLFRKFDVTVKKELISKQLKNQIFDQYREGNIKLAKALGKEEPMQQYGYY